MPFIRSTATPPIIVWTLSIIPTYHASVYPWTSVGASGLDCGAEVRTRGGVGNYRFAPEHAITAPHAIFCIQGRL
jgi:hypothetical protein